MKAELQRRIAELSEEIRHYPTPIARCDLHLPALLEERARLMEQLNSLAEHECCSPSAAWTNDGGCNAA
ncbi:MAG TPA: hypothetical protein VFI89_09415 [Burkholderiales bacterium]|jgi:hypothetical protein|nr:hypothetical protein [Burkholderiales bacterium]